MSDPARKQYEGGTLRKSRKSEKTIELHEFYVIRSGSGSLPRLCAECSTGDAFMVTPEQAAAVAAVPVRVIFRWVELGVLHFIEGADGSLAVCLKSLPATGTQLTKLNEP
jgi:hypothetical protein